MTTEDQGEHLPENQGAEARRSGSRQLIRGLIGVGLIGLAIAALVIALQPAPPVDPVELRSDLAESWKVASKDEASGVDFEMRLRGEFQSNQFTMKFDHDGKVELKDSCYEAESSYLVKSDGSIAIEDLSHAEVVGKSVGCEDTAIDGLYWTATMDYSEDGWTARGANGKPILNKIQEERIEATLESDLEE